MSKLRRIAPGYTQHARLFFPYPKRGHASYISKKRKEKKYQVLKELANQYRGKLRGKGNQGKLSQGRRSKSSEAEGEKPDETASRQRSTICWAQPLQRQLSFRVIPTEVGIN